MLLERTMWLRYFGDTGDYIIGTMSGVLSDEPGGGSGTDYNFTGSFTALRQ